MESFSFHFPILQILELRSNRLILCEIILFSRYICYLILRFASDDAIMK